MSSPFSSLKKGGRFSYLPGHIPGHRPIPFRHPEYSEDESKLLEEITTSMAASRLKARDPFNGGLPRMDPSPNPSLLIPLGKEGSNLPESENHPPPTDNELMSLMMARLTLMEQKVSFASTFVYLIILTPCLHSFIIPKRNLQFLYALIVLFVQFFSYILIFEQSYT